MFSDAKQRDAMKPVGTGLMARFAAADAKPRDDADEDACPAFGYLRGTHDRAVMIEFRFRDGNTEVFPYSWLGPVRYNPSVGLLLKFSGDTVTLVLLRGSNLDAPVGTGFVNLTDRGLHRHRVTFVREMDADELRKVGEAWPTIDRIEIGEFDSAEDRNAWIEQHAPEFARG